MKKNKKKIALDLEILELEAKIAPAKLGACEQVIEGDSLEVFGAEC